MADLHSGPQTFLLTGLSGFVKVSDGPPVLIEFPGTARLSIVHDSEENFFDDDSRITSGDRVVQMQIDIQRDERGNWCVLYPGKVSHE